jgi:hypothetical protein
MPVYSLVTGAAATGVNRSTILRAIKAGKLSAERDGSGAWVIQPVELHRLFPPLPQLPAVVEPVLVLDLQSSTPPPSTISVMTEIMDSTPPAALAR